jgi:methyl coenzyme M reductase subunit C
VEPVATVNITVAEAAVEDLQEFSMPTETIWYLRVAEEVLPETKVVLKWVTEEMVVLQQVQTDRAVQVELLVRTEQVLPVEPEERVPYKDFLERPMEAETVEQRKEMKVQAAAVVDTV